MSLIERRRFLSAASVLLALAAASIPPVVFPQSILVWVDRVIG